MDLHRDRLIHVNILQDLLATTVTSENKRKKIRKTIIRTIDLNAREDETLRDDELGSPSGVKAKTLRTIWIFFKVVQIDDNLVRPICIEDDFPSMGIKGLIEWFKANVDLFAVSTDEMLDINPSVACHQLKIDNFTYYVA